MKRKFKIGDRVRSKYASPNVTFTVVTRNPLHFPLLHSDKKYSLVYDNGVDAGWDYERCLVLVENGLQKLRKYLTKTYSTCYTKNKQKGKR